VIHSYVLKLHEALEAREATEAPFSSLNRTPQAYPIRMPYSLRVLNNLKPSSLFPFTFSL